MDVVGFTHSLLGGRGGGPSCALRPSGNPPRSSQRGDLLACCFSLPFSMEWEAGCFETSFSIEPVVKAQ